MTHDADRDGRSLRRPARLSRRVVLLALALAALLLLVGALLAAFRYLPALDDARALRTDLETMVGRVQEAGLAIDRPTLDEIEAELASDKERLGRLGDLVAGDPLVGLARALPPTATNIRGLDDVVAATGDLLGAAGDGLAIGRRFVEIREAQAAGTGRATSISQLVEMMATSRDHAGAASAAINRARALLSRVPDGVIDQLKSVRDALTTRIEEYGPLLDTYVAVSARLPAMLGWDGPRRYLVLTQDPAELRPTGGFIGSYGIIAFDSGRITELRFQDVVPLDYRGDYPVITPPQELADYLLGPKQPWQLADSNWSPDFPTSAGDALRLYTNESGDTHIDGVLGITTNTIDELLKVTGPITVADYKVTIASGETTLKVLQLTRVAKAPGQNRKAFLPVLADRLLASLLGLPPRKWGDLLGVIGTFRQERLLLAWFRDAADEKFAVDGGFGGEVKQDPGDYFYPVDSNVAPASKLNTVTTRSLNLDIRLDGVGNAQNTLEVAWDNRIEAADGAPYRALPADGMLRILGMYFRALVPERSRVEAVSGGGLAPVTNPAVVQDEAGRTAIGTYLKIPAGPARLLYSWTSPYAAIVDATGGTYRLTIQAQPGAQPGPLNLSIRAPDGYRITAASAELAVSGAMATLRTTFDRDIVVGLQYGP